MLIIALTSAAVLVACILLLGRSLIGMFTNTASVIALGTSGLHWLALGYIAFAVSQVLQGIMRGTGETIIPMWISIISTVILRMPLAYLLAACTRSAEWPNGNPVALFASLLISWILAMIMTIIAFKKGRWRARIAGVYSK